MIKPFISFRDDLPSAVWPYLENSKCKPCLLLLFNVAGFFPPLPKETNKQEGKKKKKTRNPAHGQISQTN